MALTLVGTDSGTSTTGTINTNIAGSQAGDFILVGVCIGAATSDLALSITPDHGAAVELANLYSNDNNDTNLYVGYFIHNGQDPKAIDVSGYASNSLSWFIRIYRGQDATTPLDVAVVTATAQNSSRGNPPATTPITANAKIITVYAGSQGTTGVWGVPADVSNFVQQAPAASGKGRIAVADADWTGGTFDPLPIPSGTTSTNDSNCTVTIALRPAIETYNLTSTDVATTTTSVDQSTIGQKHVFNATNLVTAAAIIAAATIGQKHVLAPSIVATTAPVVAQATIGQKHNITSTAVVTAAPAIAQPTIGQKHNLTNSNIITASPSISQVTANRVIVFTANNVTTSATSITQSGIGQKHNITVQDIVTASPVVTNPTVSQKHVLASTDVVTAPPFNMLVNGSFDVDLTGWSPNTANLSWQAGGFIRVTAFGNTSGRAWQIIPTIVGHKYLVIGDVLPGGTGVNPNIGAAVAASGTIIENTNGTGTGLSFVFTATVTNTYIRAATGTGGAGDYSEFDNIFVIDLADLPTLGQVHVLGSSGVVTSGVIISSAAITQKHNVGSTNVTTAAPVISQASLTVLSVDLLSRNIVTSGPIITISSVGQKHNLNSNILATSAPIISQSAANRIVGLTAQTVAGFAPVIASAGIGQKHNINVQNVVTSVPVIGQRTLAQIHILGTQNIITAMPAISLASMAQSNDLVSSDIVTAAAKLNEQLVINGTFDTDTAGWPISNATRLVESINGRLRITTLDGGLENAAQRVFGFTVGNSYRFIGDMLMDSPDASGQAVFRLGTSSNGVTNNVVTDFVKHNDPQNTVHFDKIFVAQAGSYYIVPSINNGVAGNFAEFDNFSITEVQALGQTHILGNPINVNAGTPVISLPAVGQSHILASNSVVTNPPVVSNVLTGQTHVLLSSGITTNSPIISNILIGDVYVLGSQSVETSVPTISFAGIGQQHNLTSKTTKTAAVVISKSGIGQRHILTAQELATEPPALGAASVGQRHVLSALGLVTAVPVVSHGLVFLGAVSLDSQPVITFAPVITKAGVGQLHHLFTNDVWTNPPVISINKSGGIPDTPAERILTIEYENRILTIFAEPLILTLEEARVLSIPFENRTWDIR